MNFRLLSAVSRAFKAVTIIVSLKKKITLIKHEFRNRYRSQFSQYFMITPLKRYNQLFFLTVVSFRRHFFLPSCVGFPPLSLAPLCFTLLVTDPLLPRGHRTSGSVSVGNSASLLMAVVRQASDTHIDGIMCTVLSTSHICKYQVCIHSIHFSL